MTDWNPNDLATLDSGDEVEVSSRRRDGSLRPYVTIWGVRVGDDFYIRSAYGAGNGWYRRALAADSGSIRGSGATVDVTYETLDATDDLHADIDAAYRAKFHAYADNIVNTVVGPYAAQVTLRVTPAV